MQHPLSSFDQVRIISLASRTDRRRDMTAGIMAIGGFDDDRIRFFDAVRPQSAGSFPSVGAHGCFLSHLAVLREARDAGVASLLILEDDVNFAPDFTTRSTQEFAAVLNQPWSIFYGTYRLGLRAPRPEGGVAVAPDLDISLAAFVAFNGAVLAPLVSFLEECMTRPAGAPVYGPMHVDGAYTVFRRLNPEVRTFASYPQLAYQRSSRSDITPRSGLLAALGGLRRLVFPRGREVQAASRWLPLRP